MNPWISIWTKVTETIDRLKETNWSSGPGLIPFFIFGINGWLGRNGLSDIVSPSGLDSIVISIALLLCFGTLGGFAFRQISLYSIYLIGKIWNGKASLRNIGTVLSLSLIPEVLKFFNLIESIAINGGDMQTVRINYILTIICFVLSFRILLIGISRVQKFGFGLALLNIFIPQLILGLIYIVISGR